MRKKDYWPKYIKIRNILKIDTKVGKVEAEALECCTLLYFVGVLWYVMEGFRWAAFAVDL